MSFVLASVQRPLTFNFSVISAETTLPFKAFFFKKFYNFHFNWSNNMATSPLLVLIGSYLESLLLCKYRSKCFFITRYKRCMCEFIKIYLSLIWPKKLHQLTLSLINCFLKNFQWKYKNKFWDLVLMMNVRSCTNISHLNLCIKHGKHMGKSLFLIGRNVTKSRLYEKFKYFVCWVFFKSCIWNMLKYSSSFTMFPQFMLFWVWPWQPLGILISYWLKFKKIQVQVNYNF